MLLRDRGFEVDQAVIGRGLPLPATAERLARRMGDLSTLAWQGGALDVPGGVTWELVGGLSRDLGTWAALLEPYGYRRAGHWVVVDGITEEGVVEIRDPAGEAYGIPLGDFAALWRYSVLVMQEIAP